MQDIIKKHYQIKRNLIFQHNYVKLLEDGKRYKPQNLRVN